MALRYGYLCWLQNLRNVFFGPEIRKLDSSKLALFFFTPLPMKYFIMYIYVYICLVQEEQPESLYLKNFGPEIQN
jgi:hypothetical protein